MTREASFGLAASLCMIALAISVWRIRIMIHNAIVKDDKEWRTSRATRVHEAGWLVLVWLLIIWALIIGGRANLFWDPIF